MKSFKTIIAAVAMFALLGAAAYSTFSYPSYASDDHDHAGEAQNHDHAENGHDQHEEEGALKLSPEQMSATGITVVAVQPGPLSHQTIVPGRIVADADRMAHIVPKVSGVVIEAGKNLGDTVKKGDVMALLESREMADVAAEYQAASRSAELAKKNHDREKMLWDKQITAQKDFLTAQNAWQEAQIRLDLAKQKMDALGGAGEKGKPSRYHELKSPLDGMVVERNLTLGEFVDTARTAFTVADLSVLWVETAIAPNDLPNIREGQAAFVEGGGKNSEGKLIFLSPVIDPDTRSAKAIIELQNPDGVWRSGDYASVSIVTGTQTAGMVVPKDAVQTMEGKPFVFVRTAEGFEKRAVTIGKKDNDYIEIASGLSQGEEIASGNTFVLKAEAGKSEAEHSH
jgi:cobalt-zinc-cadmium efflux system membrane fusion protein